MSVPKHAQKPCTYVLEKPTLVKNIEKFGKNKTSPGKTGLFIFIWTSLVESNPAIVAQPNDLLRWAVRYFPGCVLFLVCVCLPEQRCPILRNLCLIPSFYGQAAADVEKF